MGCPRCGAPWRILEKEKLICSKCNYVETVNRIKDIYEQIEELSKENDALKTENARLKKHIKDIPY